MLILLICSFGFFSAVNALLHGGRDMSPGPAVIYGIGATIICVALALTQRRYAKKAGSPLLQVDSSNWFVDGIVSSVVALTFLTAILLRGTPWAHLIPYVDPVLVMLMVVFLIRIPIVTVRDNFREILQVAPEREDQEEVRKRVTSAVADLPVEKVDVRMVKMGRYFYVMVHVILLEDYRVNRIGSLDAVRCEIRRSISDVPLRLVTDIIFTADERWAIAVDDRLCEQSTE